MISNDFLQIAMMILNLLKLIWSLLGIDNKEKSEKNILISASFITGTLWARYLIFTFSVDLIQLTSYEIEVGQTKVV